MVAVWSYSVGVLQRPASSLATLVPPSDPGQGQLNACWLCTSEIRDEQNGREYVFWNQDVVFSRTAIFFHLCLPPNTLIESTLRPDIRFRIWVYGLP